MQYLFIPAEAILYLQICAICLIVVAVCWALEFIQNMRIKAIQLETAKIEHETAKRQQELVLQAILERQNRKP